MERGIRRHLWLKRKRKKKERHRRHIFLDLILKNLGHIFEHKVVWLAADDCWWLDDPILAGRWLEFLVMNYTKRNCIKKISTSQKMQYFEKKKNLTLWACEFRQVAITLGLRNSQKGFSAAFNCSTDLQPALGSVHTSAFYLCSTLARCVWNEVFLMTWNATAYRFKKHKCELPLLYMPLTAPLICKFLSKNLKPQT